MELKKILGIENNDLSPESSQMLAVATSAQASPGLRRYRVRRKSMEQLDLIKVVFAAFNAFSICLNKSSHCMTPGIVNHTLNGICQ